MVSRVLALTDDIVKMIILSTLMEFIKSYKLLVAGHIVVHILIGRVSLGGRIFFVID
jgi:hypothetical protein